jgi:hypothetical protein
MTRLRMVCSFLSAWFIDLTREWKTISLNDLELANRSMKRPSKGEAVSVPLPTLLSGQACSLDIGLQQAIAHSAGCSLPNL